MFPTVSAASPTTPAPTTDFPIDTPRDPPTQPPIEKPTTEVKTTNESNESSTIAPTNNTGAPDVNTSAKEKSKCYFVSNISFI